MEAVPIEKPDDLIVESQTDDAKTQTAAPLLFPLDAPESIVPLLVTYHDDKTDDDVTLELFHKIKWPSLEALNVRQQQIAQRSEVLSETRRKVQSGDGVAANAILWNKFASEVKGYGWGEADIDQWVTLTPELRDEIPSEHKSMAMVCLFASDFKVERPEGRGFVLGATTYRVKQTYGPYTITHVFGKHQESDRRQVANKALDTQYETGTTKVKSITSTNLGPHIQLYDKTFDHLEGVTGSDPNITRRKDLVSPIWKHGATDALMDFFEASRRDLKKN